MHLATLNEFINSGNNLYYVIALSFVVILFVIAMISFSISKKRNKRNNKQVDPDAEEILSQIMGKPGKEELPPKEEFRIAEEPLEWESDQAIFILPDELMEETSTYENKEDFFRTLADYSLSDAVDENKPEKSTKIKEYEPKKDSDMTSIIMTPIKAKEPILRKHRVENKPQRKESSFEKDYLYDSVMSTMPGIIQLYVDNSGQYRFRFKTSNGITVGHSQSYVKKNNVKNGVNLVISIAKNAEIADMTLDDSIPILGRPIYEIYIDDDMKYRFRLVAANGINLIASQGYQEKNNCINAVQAIRDIALLHELKDQANIPEKEAEDIRITPFIETINEKSLGK